MEVGGCSKNNNKLLITRPTIIGRPITKTFNMTIKDAVASRDLVSGIILVNSINAYVLFDSGATCSFVSREFAQRLNLPCEPLDFPLNIEVANKEVIPVRHEHKNCCVEIRGHKFLVDLIPIQLKEFDVILGID